MIRPNAEVPLGWRVDLSSFRAIDPLALILSGEVYVKLTLPDPPPIEVLRAYVRSHARTSSAAEKRQALNRVRALRTYLDAVEQELGTRVGEVQKAVDASSFAASRTTAGASRFVLSRVCRARSRRGGRSR